MRHRFVTGLNTVSFVLLMGLACAAASAAEEAAEVAKAAAEDPANDEATWSFELDATVNSKYVWRGINLVDSLVFQPAVTVAYGGWSFNVWGNMETYNANHYGSHGQATNDFTEVDLTLEHAWECGDWTFALGVIHYIFPNTGFNNTTEVYGSVGYDCPLEPTVTVYQDIDEVHGTYVTLAVGHTFEEVCKPTAGTSMDIAISTSVGWGSSDHNQGYYATGDSGLADLTTSVGFPVDLGKGWSLTPALNHSTFLNKSIRNNQSPNSNVWYGLSLVYSFEPGKDD